MREKKLLSIQPGASKYEQLIAIAGALHFVTQCSHQGATLMFTHPPDTEVVAGHLLVFEQCAASAVHRLERGDPGIRDAELDPEMPPQARRADAQGEQ